MPRRPIAAACLGLALLACGDDLTETRPPEHDGTRSLGRAELRWCMFNDIRIEAARPLIRGVKGNEIQAFNAAVTEWNQGCRRYRYRRSDRDAVQQQIDARRAALETEGKTRFAASTMAGAPATGGAAPSPAPPR